MNTYVVGVGVVVVDVEVDVEVEVVVEVGGGAAVVGGLDVGGGPEVVGGLDVVGGTVGAIWFVVVGASGLVPSPLNRIGRPGLCDQSLPAPRTSMVVGGDSSAFSVVVAVGGAKLWRGPVAPPTLGRVPEPPATETTGSAV